MHLSATQCPLLLYSELSCDSVCIISSVGRWNVRGSRSYHKDKGQTVHCQADLWPSWAGRSSQTRRLQNSVVKSFKQMCTFPLKRDIIFISVPDMMPTKRTSDDKIRDFPDRRPSESSSLLEQHNESRWPRFTRLVVDEPSDVLTTSGTRQQTAVITLQRQPLPGALQASEGQSEALELYMLINSLPAQMFSPNSSSVSSIRRAFSLHWCNFAVTLTKVTSEALIW